MNIFAVDDHPYHAARSLSDSHVVKMPTESVQILSEAWRRHVLDEALFPTGICAARQARHPCCLWAGDSYDNYVWLVQHAYALVLEHGRRWPRSKRHGAAARLETLASPPPGIPEQGRTPFVQCMPPEYQGDDPVAAYRRFYVAEKLSLATHRYRYTKPPSWARLDLIS